MCVVALVTLKIASLLFALPVHLFFFFYLKLLFFGFTSLNTLIIYIFNFCLDDLYLHSSISESLPPISSRLAVRRKLVNFLFILISLDFFSFWHAFMGFSWRIGWSITFVPLSNYVVLRPLSFLHLVGGLHFVSRASLKRIFIGVPPLVSNLEHVERNPIKGLDLGRRCRCYVTPSLLLPCHVLAGRQQSVSPRRQHSRAWTCITKRRGKKGTKQGDNGPPGTLLRQL